MVRNSQSQGVTRRRFLKTGAALTAAPTIISARAIGRKNAVAASERVTIGVIGTGNQGLNDIRSFLGDGRVQIVAVCDVNRESPGYWNGGVAGREPAKRLIEGHYAKNKPSGEYKGCEGYVDFRDVLARKDIDAVEVCTPDHWHAIPVIEACKAGKDVYCQKPLTLTIAEGRAMCNAVKKHERIFQTGSQQRSDSNFRRACELVLNGSIGKLHTVRVGLPGGRPDFGKTGDRKKPEKVPKGFEYDRWLGPAPEAPYAPARCHVNFRWIYDYSGGQVTDWGGHHPDCAQWGMGTDRTGPIEIRAAKAKFDEDPLWNTATEFYFEAIYASGVKMIVSNREKMGVRFEGSEGWVTADRGRHDASDKKILDSKIGEKEIHLYESNDHFRNFIDGVLGRKECVAPCEVAHRSITICHLGNIAMRLGRETLKWNPEKEEIVDDAEAAKWLSREYRGPWKLEA
jgi:predicted dehydrogenase